MTTLLTRALTPMPILAAFAVAVLILLALPISLPIGPNYWDLYTYVDTAYRMQWGQLPNVDFFVPVGPLGYILYVGVIRIFPEAHTLLAVHYCMLVVTLPLMLLIVRDVAKRSAFEALALVIPFVLFAGVPINGIELYPSPGFDAYGNYNRHTAQLLYVLAAATLLVENRKLASALIIVTLAALFTTKITGFVVGLPIAIHAFMLGRTDLRSVVITTIAILIAMLAVEISTQQLGHYLRDIATLISLNSGGMLPRLLTVLSVKLDVIAPAVALIAVLLWQQRLLLAGYMVKAAKGRSWPAVQRLLDSDPAILSLLLLAGFLFETQNTGSHEFILLWPALLRLFQKIQIPLRAQSVPVLILIAAVALPTPTAVLHRAARAIISIPKYQAINVPEIGPVGRVSAKPDVIAHAKVLLAYYPTVKAQLQTVAKNNALPSYILFSELDFQINWLISSHEAAKALLAYEAQNNIRFPQVITLDFVDPLPAMLGRVPLRFQSVGYDPERTPPGTYSLALREISKADAILLPLCPVITSRNAIAEAYAPALEGRKRIALTPCFDMLLK